MSISKRTLLKIRSEALNDLQDFENKDPGGLVLKEIQIIRLATHNLQLTQELIDQHLLKK